MKIEMYLYYLTRRQRMPISGLIEKRVIFSHAYRGSSRSLHGVTTHVKPPGFKQLNWRIRENLSQAINKLSLLVSEDAMIVPATYIYSVSTFAQNSLDMSPWSKHHYFRFYKLDVAKVINRLILSCTPLTTVACKIFRYFVSITKLVLRWLDTVFQGQYLPSLSINYVAINKVLEKLPLQLY